MYELYIETKIENVNKLTDFVNNHLNKFNCSPKIKMQIDITVDEIFSSISKCVKSKKDMSKIKIFFDAPTQTVTLCFCHNGIGFNPLKNEEFSIKMFSENGKTDGLSDFIIKKLSDNIKYEKSDSENILTISKKLQ